MQKKIIYLNIHKTSLAAAAVMSAMMLIVPIIIVIPALFSGSIMTIVISLILAFFIPGVYFGITYIMTAFLCWIYNLCSAKFNIGITFTTEGVE